MQNTMDWSKKYYSPEAQEKIAERGTCWTPELQAQASRDWEKLFADVEASLGEDPKSARAQELAARWKTLVESFTGGDAEVTKGLKALYADKESWPETYKEKVNIRPEIWDFIQRAFAASTPR